MIELALRRTPPRAAVVSQVGEDPVVGEVEPARVLPIPPHDRM
jgi:hypothetical protein